MHMVSLSAICNYLFCGEQRVRFYRGEPDACAFCIELGFRLAAYLLEQKS